jgi:hypothetical protein
MNREVYTFQHHRRSLHSGPGAFSATASSAQSLLSPVLILPEQFCATSSRSYKMRGEIALMCAVLEEAIESFRRYSVVPGRRPQRLAREAEEWILSTHPQWPFSYVNICAALGLNPEYVRKWARQWRQQHPPIPPQKRKRRSVRTPADLKIAA